MTTTTTTPDPETATPAEPTVDPDSPAGIAARQAEIVSRWTTARIALDADLAAIQANLAGNVDRLAVARREAVLGEDRDQDIASLIGHQRALEAKAAEIGERLAVATSEEAAASRGNAQAQIAAAAAAYIEEARHMAGQAERLDGEIDAWVRAGRDLLAARWKIVQDCGEIRIRGIPELMAIADAQGLDRPAVRLEWGAAMEFRAGDLPAFGNDVDVPAHFRLEV